MSHTLGAASGTVGSDVAHRVAPTLATVRRPDRACRFPAHGFHEDAGLPRCRRRNQSMDLLSTRWVDPVRQYPRTRAYGFFAKGTVPTSLILTHLVFSLVPTVFASCLPRPIPSPVARSHGFRHISSVLFSWPTTDRALLATSLLLIGLLTPEPPGDSASPPEVTRCSSVPCRPQTPWCGG